MPVFPYCFRNKKAGRAEVGLSFLSGSLEIIKEMYRKSKENKDHV
jgi:hypothetical protein